METDRPDGRTPNQLRPLAYSCSILHRAHGSASWAQGETKVLAAVYGPKAGTKKNENPEKASIEVIWKPKTGQIGKMEKEYEMILKRTLESICIRTIYPNTTTSVIVQVVHDDGALLPCAINAACAALVDAGIPLKHLAVAICCSVTDSGCIILDPTKDEEERSLQVGSEPMENGIMTSVTQGAMSVNDYLHCLERGRAACASLSEFVRKNIGTKSTSEPSKAG
uniref:Exosome complex exonuclease RRP46 homolog n=1 Tax=Glycine max TaxID=3847 RepID=A0A0R0FNH9_SOYBN